MLFGAHGNVSFHENGGTIDVRGVVYSYLVGKKKQIWRVINIRNTELDNIILGIGAQSCVSDSTYNWTV